MSSMERYNRIAVIYELMELPMELLAFSSWRRMLFGELAGHGAERVLEVGVGTGKNIPFYPRGMSFTALDVSERMLSRARKRAAGRAALVLGDAERLPFRSSSFDACISTYVFCSVDDPLAGLRELRRVLKRGGRAYFLEHMRSENRAVGLLQDLLNPAFRLLGPEINRPTKENIAMAGFGIVEERHLLGTVFRFIVAEKR